MVSVEMMTMKYAVILKLLSAQELTSVFPRETVVNITDTTTVRILSQPKTENAQLKNFAVKTPTLVRSINTIHSWTLLLLSAVTRQYTLMLDPETKIKNLLKDKKDTAAHMLKTPQLNTNAAKVKV